MSELVDNEPTVSPADGLYALPVKRPVAVCMIVLAITVFGLISKEQIPVALMPPLAHPTLTLRTEFQGAAPEDVEEFITKPLEELLRTVEGVRSITSITRPGRSEVVLRFSRRTSMDLATQKIRERVQLVTLPDDVDRPLILRYDPALDPILRIGVWGRLPLTEIRRVTEDVVEKSLEKVEGVAMVKVRGGLDSVIRVDVNPWRLASLGVTIESVSNHLAAQNVNVAGGALIDGEITYLVRTINAFESIADMKSLAVAQIDGVVIRLEDVATVYTDSRDPDIITRIGNRDGVREGVIIEIFKEADANLVEVSEKVNAWLLGTPESRRKRAETLGKQTARALVNRASYVAEGRRGRVDVVAKGRSHLLTDLLPPELTVAVLDDQAIFVKRSVDEVINTALLGALLAIAVVFLFLRTARSTLAIGLSIPISVVATFSALRLSGITLNVMSLGGIALGIGMLVDNSIVVLESIHRCREEGDPPWKAAIRGTEIVGGAVFASTLTTVAVFFPIVFVEGIAGQLFYDLALAVAFALFASLAVALFFIPMAASRPPLSLADGATLRRRFKMTLTSPLLTYVQTRDDTRSVWVWYKAQAGGRRALAMTPLVFILIFLTLRAAIITPLELVFGRIIMGGLYMFLWAVRGLVRAAGRLQRRPDQSRNEGEELKRTGITQFYRRILAFALRFRWSVVFIQLILFAWSANVFSSRGMDLIPSMHQGQFELHLQLPIGTRITETSNVVKRLEHALTSIDSIDFFSDRIGIEREELQVSTQGEHTARITVRLKESDSPQAQQDQVIERIRELAGRLPGTHFEFVSSTLFDLATPFEVQLFGDDLRSLRRATLDAAIALGKTDVLADIRHSMNEGLPELQVRLDREKLTRHGLTVQTVGETLRDHIKGREPTVFKRGAREWAIIVRTEPKEIGDLRGVDNLLIPSRSGGTAVPLRTVGRTVLETGPSEIHRVDGRRAARISADVPLTSLSRATTEIEQTLDELPLPPDVTIRLAGQTEDMIAARKELLRALLLAVLLVYIVLASKFESLAGPFVILLSIPMALVGVAPALAFLDIRLSVLVFIGLIMLAGIVVNNAIVLVDYIHRRRDEAADLDLVIVDACSVRLRPVLITTLTTILGLLPMALAMGDGAELRTPLAITVISGLASATVLTLVVVPCLYRILVRRGSYSDHSSA
jgi:hydrophobic/amphiphilic exporter-1 (mainly G- bacteria), HAE1 family